MDEWGIDNVVIDASENVFRDTLGGRILNVVMPLHFSLVVFVEKVGMQYDDGEGDEVSLVYFLLAGDGPCSKGVHTWINVYARITFVISVRKTLKNTVNLLRLLWQFHLHK